jgi:hypothetical protein
MFSKRFLIAAVLLAGSSSVMALPILSTNITIYDNNSDVPSGNSWYGTQEDEEVEPGANTGQDWDLEKFFSYGALNTSLGMVGGFDLTGYYDPTSAYYQNNDYRAGDIFIDTNGSTTNDPGAYGGGTVTDTFGYEYALDIDWFASTYTVWQLNPGTTTTSVIYSNFTSTNPSSNPWTYVGGGTQIGGTHSFTYEDGITDAQSGMTGGTHYAAYGFDLGFLASGTTYQTHNTMACGNDNLMGRATTLVPDVPASAPGTLALVGLGLLCLGRSRKGRA